MSASASAIRHSSFDLRTSPLVSVCSEIGRGHPAYLDSVLLALSRLCKESQPAPMCLTVPDLCTGTSGLAWKLARLGYRFGAQGGPATWLYNRLRSPDARPSGLQLALLGASLRRTFTGYAGICIVDHPLLAHILTPVCRVAYLHCEIAAPGLAAVPQAWRTFVPLESTRQKLLAVGCQPSAVCVTGLVIEAELTDIAQSAFHARITRLASDRPLTIGFFASGAEPRPHSSSIITGTASVTRAGHKALLFSGTGMLRAAKTQLALRRQGVPEESARVIWTRNRQHGTSRAAEFFPDLDILVAAAHERTNWAVGLGLPMFALMPNIGPFAAGNFAFAREQGTCVPLDGIAGAVGLDDTIADLRRSGRLAEMARNGWQVHSIDGAARIARALHDTASSSV
ncbi:MAG: hypothetical protein NTX53_17270 [candidate division WOR-3 bacterium]|nr:hypothetical protein [candidate division WOR-3 bacterium]